MDRPSSSGSPRSCGSTTRPRRRRASTPSIFPNSKIVTVTRYSEAGPKAAGRPEGSVMTVEFELDGQQFTALNGGPLFKFNEAISLVVNCERRPRSTTTGSKLSTGGDPKAQQCGWLKDRYGVSWQVVPSILAELVTDPDKQRAGRAMGAMFR